MQWLQIPMQISEYVHALKVPFQIPLAPGVLVDRFVNCFIILGDEIILIDTGVLGSEERIYDLIRQAGRDPREIGMVLQTHSHPDHIGATLRIQRDTDCLVLIHGKERAWLEDVDSQARERPVPGFHQLVGGSVKVDHELADGEMLDLGRGLGLKVIHTPGHSVGSCSFLLNKDKVLFTGDAVPVPGDLPIYEDVRATVTSIARLSRLKGTQHLLASWDLPREGKGVKSSLQGAMDHVQSVHDMILRLSTERNHRDLMELTVNVQKELGLPFQKANPLIARTVQAHLSARCCLELMDLGR